MKLAPTRHRHVTCVFMTCWISLIPRLSLHSVPNHDALNMQNRLGEFVVINISGDTIIITDIYIVNRRRNALSDYSHKIFRRLQPFSHPGLGAYAEGICTCVCAHRHTHNTHPHTYTHTHTHTHLHEYYYENTHTHTHTHTHTRDILVQAASNT